jgi:hypothetical protein
MHEVREKFGVEVLLEVRILREVAGAMVGGAVVGNGGRTATARSG